MLQLPPFRYLGNNAALYAGAGLASVVITSGTSFSVAENTTAVATLTATGGGTITWSLTGGADLAKFTIGSSSGVLTFNSAPDFETPTDANADNIYLVQVQATNGVTSDTKSLSITVTDVVETVLDLDFTTMAPTLDSRITFSRTSTGTYYNSSGVLTTAASGAPRFDYDPVTHAANGLLIEDTRTNSVGYSERFDDTAWTKTGATVTVNQITAPDGVLSADLITSSATVATLSQSGASISTGVDYCMSIYAKKGTSDWFYICAQITVTGPETPKAYFNLATGTVGTVETNITSASIQAVGNGWYRCSVRRLGTAGTERLTVGPCDGNGSDAVTIGRTVYFWGAQFESGALVTSYITNPAGTLQSRSVDVATMTGTNFSSWYNQTAGTFVGEFDVLRASGTRGILAADNNTAAEMIRLYGSGTDPKVTITDNSVTQADLDLGTIAANTTYKLGVSYVLNDIAACLNGGTVGTDTVATLPTPTQLRIGVESATAGNTLNGHVRRIQFWNIAKSDAELQALTT